MDDQSVPPARRSRIGRLRQIAFCAVMCGIAAVWSMNQPWYSFEMSNVAIVDSGYQTQTVSASSSVSGAELANQVVAAPSITTDAMLKPNSTLPTGYEIPLLSAGERVPAPVVFVAVGGLLVLAAATLRSRLLGLVAVGVNVLSFRALTAIVDIVEDPAAGGQYVTRAQGLQVLQLSMAAGTAVAAVGVFMIFSVLKQEHRDAKDAAIAAGAAATDTAVLMPLGPMDWLRGVSRLAGDKVRESAEEAARAHHKT